MRNINFILLLVVLFGNSASAQKITYLYPVNYFTVKVEGGDYKMAYIDIKPSMPYKEIVLLLHGKNFNGYYWTDVIAFLSDAGYRVIAPDQLGFGKSDKPGIHYSFHMLAANTKKLLDSLGVEKFSVIGHSMGGMLAARIALMYPQSVNKLIFENPIGLEDYRTFVPYQSIDELLDIEKKSNYESLKNYQKTYYPQWSPDYEQYVEAQHQAMQYPDPESAAWASALTYQMIYEQPIVYEFKNLGNPTLIVIGQLDRTVVGKKLLTEEGSKNHGNYPVLGKWLSNEIKGSILKELTGTGHIPHVQSLNDFKKSVLDFLR